MAAKGSFNMFQSGAVEPNPQMAANLFSFIATDQNGNERPPISSTVTKRQTFRNEIRLQKNEQKRKFMRMELIKSLESKTLFALIESLASKENYESKNISNLITDLRRNISDWEFCKQLNQQTEIKKFILNLYLNNQDQLPIEQKCLLISCLTYLTFYHMNAFDIDQKHKLNDTMIKEIAQIKEFDWPNIEYLRKNIDLLTNIISDQDADINHYLLDTNLFISIGNKITQIANVGQKMTESNQNDEEIRNRFEQELDNIRDAFISTLLNLSKPDYHNDAFFEFTIGELVGDINYLAKNGVMLLKILSNFFQNQKYRLRFIETTDLLEWFENQVALFCQKKFMNSDEIKTGKFSETKLNSQERELFFQFLDCILNFIEEEEDEVILKQFWVLLDFSRNSNCLSSYFLSQFMIQCSRNDECDKTLIRNSRYVSKAIQMYEFLADNLKYDLKDLLVVTSERHFEDIFKVLLDETYFTSHKIAQTTISLLNKMLSKDPKLINTLNELGIFESIDNFLSQPHQIQKPEQIINFFDLLTLMVDSDQYLDNGKNEKQKQNYVARRIQQEGFIKKIQDYQNHENRNVSDKAQTFLEYLCRVREQNDRPLLGM